MKTLIGSNTEIRGKDLKHDFCEEKIRGKSKSSIIFMTQEYHSWHLKISSLIF
jgi:hypothetical protein